ncbi:MAG: hypothetical protein WC686_02125 [Candidatus Shapirobacteria bacterium]
MSKLISNSKREQLLTACESLILRGIEKPTDVSSTLHISFNTAKSYISIIRERWSLSVTTEELQAKRRELINKTENVLKEAYELKGKSKNTLESVQALRTVLMAIERLQKLIGLDDLPKPKSELIQQNNIIFQMAQTIQKLPNDQKEKVLQRIREEKIKRGSLNN